MRELLISILSALLLTGCSEVEKYLRFGSCSSFNGSKDSFAIKLDYNWWDVYPGAQFKADYTATWVDDYYNREELNCTVDWQISNPSVLQLSEEEENTFNVLNVGFSRATAVITGSSTKTVSLEVVSLPPPTETEPNNGTASANPIAANSAHVGRLDYQGDIDYFAFFVPAGEAFQVDLGFPVDISDSEFINAPYFISSIQGPNGQWFGSVNRTYTNDTGADATFYASVQPSSYYFKKPVYEIYFHLIK